MDAHPIPQNVTSFEFHLIGDMTLKQFGYLATGVTFAYLIFVAFAVNYPFVSWPLILLSTGLGFAFAFVPIGSRPLDHWLKAFLKAIYSPTRRVWKKNSQTAAQNPLFKSRLLMYAPSFGPQAAPPPSSVPNPVASFKPPVAPAAPAPQPLPTKEELSKTVDLAREAQGLQVKIIQTERQLTQLRAQSSPQTEPAEYTRQVNTILEQLQKLLNQASGIKQQIDILQQPANQSKTTTEAVVEPKVKVKVALPAKPKQTQVALTTFPNVINGIVKDINNNYLEAVVVVIYDKEGMPVRALKTNKLGQFSGSTPLPNGTYTIETEKEGTSFDVLQIELEGQVLPPLPITAKQ